MAQVSVRGRAKEPSSKSSVANFCDLVIKISLYLAVVLVPMFFLTYTLDPLELNKQNVLLVIAIISLVAWLGKSIASGNFEFRKNILNIPIVVFWAIYGVSSFFSLNRYQSFISADQQEGFSFITMTAFLVIYFVTVNNLDTIKKIKGLITAGLISSFVVAFHGLMQLFGKFMLPFAITKTSSFNLIGTHNSLGIFCAFSLTLAIAYLVSLYAVKKKATESIKDIVLTIFLWASVVLNFLVLVVVDYWVVWAMAILAMIILLAFSFSRATHINTKWMMLPMIILVLSVLLMVANLPLNVLGVQLPTEVSPSYKSSWEITKGALQENPLLGSGPGTFLYDYSKYKPEAINNTIFWNFKFDRAISQLLTFIATIGILGTVSWLLLFGAFIFLIVSKLAKAQTDENWILGTGLFAAWAIVFVSKLLYSSNITLDFLSWMFLAVLAVFALSGTDIRRVSFETSPKTGLIISFVFIIVVTFSASGLYLIGQRFVAEAYYVKGLNDAVQIDDFGEINNSLSKAVILNKNRDLFYRTISNFYFLEIQKTANLLQETTDDNQKSVYAQDIQNLTGSAVSMAKKATDLNKNNVENWSVLANIYQQISSYVAGALDLSIENFEKASELDPTNPVHYTNLAKSHLIYYRGFLDASKVEGADKATLEGKAQENLQKAIENLDKALKYKSNYASAHYQMAIVHVYKGDIENAINELLINYNINPNDVGNLFQLGLLYYQNEEMDKAVAVLQRTVELSPNYSNARWYLAAFYEEQGEISKAIEQIEAVEKLNPDNDLVKEKLNALRSGKSVPAKQLPEPVETTPANPSTVIENTSQNSAIIE